MEHVSITELRKHLPRYLKRAGRGEEIRITSRGKVIARLLPAQEETEAARRRLQALRGTAISGDVVSPVDALEWTGDANNL